LKIIIILLIILFPITAYAAPMEEHESLPDPEKLFEELFRGEDYNENINVLTMITMNEAEGVFKDSKTNFIAVVNVILNRSDAGKRGNSPRECALAKGQFSNRKRFVNPIFRAYVKRMVDCWILEKYGYESDWRVIPQDMLYMASYYNSKEKCRLHRFRVNRGYKYTPLNNEFWENWRCA
jgi:hypothetical protein